METANDKQATAEDADHARRDLAAQEDMAKWAKFMLGVGGAETIITFLGLLLIWRTLIHTRRAADYAKDMVDDSHIAVLAAQDANLATREIGEAQSRAYIHTQGANGQINTTARGPGTLRLYFGLDMYNSGQTPARQIQISARMVRNDATETVLHQREGLLETHDLVPNGVRGIYVGHVDFGLIEFGEFAQNKKPFRMVGRINYRPAVGNALRFTAFNYEIGADLEAPLNGGGAREVNFSRAKTGNEEN